MKIEVRGLRLDRGDARRIDPAHLARPDAERAPAAAEYDRIRFHELRHPPREEEVGQLLPVRRALRDHFQLAARDVAIVGRLHEHATAHALEIDGVRAASQRDDEHAHIDLRRKCRRCRFRYFGCDNDFDELLAHGLRRRLVDRPVERDDATEGRRRVRR